MSEKIRKFESEEKAEKKTISGECRYCGTFKLVQAENQAEADRLVTDQCSCATATSERNRRETLKNLRKAVRRPEEETGFPIMISEIQGLCEEIATLMMDYKMEAVKIDLADRQINMKRDDGIKFKQTKKIEVEEVC